MAGSGSDDERRSRADLWEAGAEERERLADERERLADERDALAEERERLADRHEQELDRRKAEERAHGNGDADEAADAAAAEAALRRAEAGVERAEAQLLRAQQAAARVAAHTARRLAATARATAATQEQEGADDEVAWLADRRDFVAVEREALAHLRGQTADERDETAAGREHVADARERELLDRERRLDQRRRPGHVASRSDATFYADLRRRGERQRERAATRRRTAASDRARAAETWGPQPYGPMLVASFGQLAQTLFGSDDLAENLPEVLRFAVGAVAGCEWASVTLWRHDRVAETLATDAVAAEFDAVQFDTGQGPAPDALHSEHPVDVPRLAESPDWPVMAGTAAQLGVASALCHGLFVHQPAHWSALGVLSLYGAVPEAFTEEDQEFASILAAYVAVAVAMVQRQVEVERREAALHRALSTRDIIGQAKGILMERQRMSAGDAFDLLRRASQRLNRKLAEVARHLAETGELPS